jgi:hypothetical protein
MVVGMDDHDDTREPKPALRSLSTAPMVGCPTDYPAQPVASREEREADRELFLRAATARTIERRLAAPESPMQGLELVGGGL